MASNIWSIVEQRRKPIFWRDIRIVHFAMAGKVFALQCLAMKKAKFGTRYVLVNHDDLAHSLWRRRVMEHGK